ncbi:sugar ABC transporter permease [Vallitalea sediminicola]
MKKFKNSKIILFIVFLLPTCLVFSTFILYPIFSTFINSFFDWSGLSDQKTFIGLTNYIDLFQDSSFKATLVNNLYVIIASVLFQIPLGLLLALVIVKNNFRNKLLSIIYFLPYLLSTMAVGLVWTLFYDPYFGVINNALKSIGVEKWQVTWLADPKTALVAVLIVVIWFYAPFYMVILRAALVGVSKSLYEAAEIDGASKSQQFFKITLPTIKPTLVTSSILSIVGSLKSFDIFYIMTNGGPGTSTELVGTYMYKQAFVNYKMGYASSIAFVMFLITLLVSIFVKTFNKRKGQA